MKVIANVTHVTHLHDTAENKKKVCFFSILRWIDFEKIKFNLFFLDFFLKLKKNKFKEI